MRIDLWNYPEGTTTPWTSKGSRFGQRTVRSARSTRPRTTLVRRSSSSTPVRILGRKVGIDPGRMAERIDLDRREAEVRPTKDQIKNAPELDEVTDRSDTYREQVGTYYSTYSSSDVGIARHPPSPRRLWEPRTADR